MASRSGWGSAVCTLAKRRCDLDATGGRQGAAERMRKAAEGVVVAVIGVHAVINARACVPLSKGLAPCGISSWRSTFAASFHLLCQLGGMQQSRLVALGVHAWRPKLGHQRPLLATGPERQQVFARTRCHHSVASASRRQSRHPPVHPHRHRWRQRIQNESHQIAIAKNLLHIRQRTQGSLPCGGRRRQRC